MDQKMIIYKATNLINSKSYIGQTIKLLEDRKKEHITCSQSKYKKQHFQKALKKYGSENFKWKIIDKCNDIIWLNELEKYYIYYYDTFGKNGYNSTTGGEQGYILSKETKRKISKSVKGFKHTEESKKKISETKKGIKLPPRTKEYSRKMSEAKKGRKIGPRSEESKKKQSELMKGRTVSKESKKKQSKSMKGKNTGPKSEKTKRKIRISTKKNHLSRTDPERWKEICRKQSELMKGRTVSEEAKKKQSESMKKTWKKRKGIKS